MNNYLFLQRGELAKFYGPINETEIGHAQQFFISRGYNAWRIGKPPTERTIRRWKSKAVKDEAERRWIRDFDKVRNWKVKAKQTKKYFQKSILTVRSEACKM